MAVSLFCIFLQPLEVLVAHPDNLLFCQTLGQFCDFFLAGDVSGPGVFAVDVLGL